MPDLQQEHGIHIDGGSDITLIRPFTRQTRGDGIYVGFQEGKNEPPVRVVIKDPDIQYASRHGIAPVAGQVTIEGGHLDHVGYHSINFEPSTAVEATSIRGVVEGIDVRHHGELASNSAGYAVAAGGAGRYLDPPIKPSIRIENITGDDLHMTVRATARVIVCNNVSDTPATIDFPATGPVTFIGNVRITPVAAAAGAAAIEVQPAASLGGVPRCLRQLSAAHPGLLWDALQDSVSIILGKHWIRQTAPRTIVLSPRSVPVAAMGGLGAPDRIGAIMSAEPIMSGYARPGLPSSSIAAICPR